jgi:dipeptidyl aminopeptidase/acylaminoacyl peptidase
MLDQGAESLCRAGFVVVAIDLRNHGNSADFGPVTLGAAESDDVLATLRYLSARAACWGIDPRKIGLRGESMGGATCLIAAARDTENRVAAIWTDSAYGCAVTAVTDFLSFVGIWRILGPAVRFWMSRITGLSLCQASPIKFLDRIRCPVCVVHSVDDRMLPVRHYESLIGSDRWQNQPESWVMSGHDHNRLWREPTYHARQIDFFRRHLVGDRGTREEQDDP